MAAHNELGKQGEQLAAEYIKQQGLAILFRNWRHGHYEIDIIAQKGNKLHFVEVKIRSSKVFGLPEEKVDRKKFQSLQRAANEFLYQFPHYRHVQFDILAINTSKHSPPEYFFIEDVYL